MKKFLLTLIVTMLAFVGVWGQTSSSVYKFTQKAADGGLYTDDQGTAATGIVSGQIFSGNYYVLEDQYNPTGAGVPATSTEKVFNVKTYYVKNADVYSTAFEKAYNASNQYATVNSIETRQLDFTASTTQDYEDYIDAVVKLSFTSNNNNGAAFYMADVASVDEVGVGDAGVAQNASITFTPVTVGDAFDDSKVYVYSYSLSDERKYVNGILYDGEEWKLDKQWYVTEKTFEYFVNDAIGNVYVENDGIYTAITSTEYTSGTPYFTVSFNDIAIADNETTIGSQDIFNTTETVVLGAGEELYYSADATEYTPVTNGEVYKTTGAYYTKEQVYNSKTVDELIALGYVSEETSLYMCDVEKDGNTITISYDYNKSYNGATKTIIDFIAECPSEISGFENVVIKSNDTGNASIANITNILTVINSVTGITNLVLDEMANNGILEYDLTALTNPAVKRIILPTVGANNPDFSDTKSGLDKIIAKNAATKPVLEVVAHNGSGDDEKYRCFIYSPEEGSLAAIKNSHYYSTNISKCTRQVYSGYVGGDDYEWFNGVSTSELDMSGLGFKSDAELADLKATIHNLDNDVIQYLALPVFDALPVEPLYKDLRAYCSNLIAVGQFVFTGTHKDASNNDVADGTLNVYSKEPGKVAIITDMLDNVTSKKALIYGAKLSGNLNAADMSNGNTYIDADGHAFTWHVDRTNSQGNVVQDADMSNTGAPNGALTGATIKSIDLKDAVFPVQTDMNIANTCGGTNLEAVVLPTSPLMTTICNGSLANMRGITEICIPYNIKVIGEGAFRNDDPMTHVTATDAEGNVIDNGPNTMTLPSQLEEVKVGAFALAEKFLDVYVLATKAPKCEKDAFGAGTLTGWGGFNSTAPITRDSYGNIIKEPYTVNKTFAILHYPSNTTEAEVKNYVDATRVYSIPDGLQSTDANGQLIYWPTQLEYNHYENDAVWGYIWNDIEGDAADLGDFNGVDRGLPGVKPTSYIWNSNLTVKTTAEKYNEDYMGWHQFVLIYASNGIHEDPKWDFSNIYDNEWWTICVPFDMTKRDLINVFGTSAREEQAPVLYTEADVNAWVDAQNAPHQVRDEAGNQPGTAGYTPTYPSDYTPKTAADCGFSVGDTKVPGHAARDEQSPVLCTLERVTRNSGTEIITFGFGQDLLKDKADDAVILEAGKAYMIKPNMPAELVSTTFRPGSHVVEYTPKFTSSTVYPLYNTTINAIDQNNAETGVKYNFVGTYVPQKMPAHSFFLGWDASNTVSHVAYYHQKNISVKDSWKPYTAIIVPEMTTEAHETHPTSSTTIIDYYTVTSGNDDFGTNQAKVATTFVDYDNNEITRINGMSVDPMRASNVVYNLNGQIVNTNGSVEGLSKGIYVVNGKKIIVK